MQAPVIYCIGECMIEFSNAGGDRFRRSFAGDVYNTAVYASRLAPEASKVEFVTATGDDPASSAMAAAWKEEGIGAAYAGVVKGGAPGLYVIDTDEQGERQFSYWRGQSAARRLLLGVRMIDPASLSAGDVICFSGITLAILGPDDRRALLDFVAAAREAGALIAFDPNFRPALWEDRDVAADAVLHAYRLADVALTGAEEERDLFGCGDEQRRLDVLQDMGVKEGIVKAGARGVFGRANGTSFHVPFEPAARVVDTTAAGDSFAGAYLAFRLRGAAPEQAVALAGAAARIVVSYPGAIIDPRAFADDLKRDRVLAEALSPSG